VVVGVCAAVALWSVRSTLEYGQVNLVVMWLVLEDLLGPVARKRWSGVLLGLAIGSSRLIYRGLYPVLVGFNSIPKVAVVPVFVIWFGIGIASKVAVTFVLIAVLFFFTVYSGIKEVDQRLVDRVRRT